MSFLDKVLFNKDTIDQLLVRVAVLERMNILLFQKLDRQETINNILLKDIKILKERENERIKKEEEYNFKMMEEMEKLEKQDIMEMMNENTNNVKKTKLTELERFGNLVIKNLMKQDYKDNVSRLIGDYLIDLEILEEEHLSNICCATPDPQELICDPVMYLNEDTDIPLSLYLLGE